MLFLFNVSFIAIYDLTIILHTNIMLRRTFPDTSIGLSKYFIKSNQVAAPHGCGSVDEFYAYCCKKATAYTYVI